MLSEGQYQHQSSITFAWRSAVPWLFSSGCLLCMRACYSAAALVDFVEMQCVKMGSGQIFPRYREQACGL